MKFTKLAGLFKKCHRITVAKFDGDLWLGNGIALYRIEGDIKADDKGLCSLLNIPDSRRDDMRFDRDNEEIIKRLQIMTDVQKRVEIYKMSIDYLHHNKTVRIYATELGVCMFERKLIDIADGIEGEYVTYIGKTPLLGLWDGGLQAIIAPMQNLTEKELTKLERLLAQVKLARDNEILIPSEQEQVEFDDYPF